MRILKYKGIVCFFLLITFAQSPSTSEVKAIWTKARFSFGGNNRDVHIDGTESWAQNIVFSDNW